jgi:hypothetical protein
MSPNQVQQAVGGNPGYVEGREAAGDGWTFREVANACADNPEGIQYGNRALFWNPYSTRHPEYPDGYWKVSSAASGTKRFEAAPPDGPVTIPGDDSPGFDTSGSTSGGESLWDEVGWGIEEWWDHGGLGSTGDDG